MRIIKLLNNNIKKQLSNLYTILQLPQFDAVPFAVNELKPST